jgi:hypothetical protein
LNYSQSFQSANFRSGQQGQQQSFGANVASQYQAAQKSYQPTGFVQSAYGQNQQQNQNQLFSNAFQNQANASAANQYQSNQLGGFQNPQSYHMSNYRGNQQGHDSQLRSDTAQFGRFGTAFAGAQAAQQQGAYGMQAGSFGGNQYQAAQQNPQSFHAANYKGNQQGHDNYLRADSQQPSYQSAAGFGASSQQGMNAYAANQFQAQNAQAQNIQAQNPQSYHLAHYQGNQQGHDQQWRADATQPSSSYGFQSGAFGMK